MIMKSNACPVGCKCTLDTFICTNAGLKELPKIPLLARYIDLSNNPLLHTEQDSFKNFSHLDTLLLNSCNQKGPIDLPRSLRKLGLGLNSMTIDALEKMLNHQSLKSIDLRENNLNITRLFPILPSGIEYLDLSGNILVSLKRHDLQFCKKLKVFECGNCGLKSIEQNALDSTRELSRFMIYQNQVASLPNKLFQFNRKIYDVGLYANRLKTFNASKLSLQKLLNLDLGYNRIESFDLTTMKSVLSIYLGGNEITELGDCAFCSLKYAQHIYLQDNNISKISQRAFANLKFISELVLYNNSIEKLPKCIFNEMKINKIFLQQNRLSNLSGVLHAMKRPPTLLALFLNTEMKFFNAADFDSMTKGSEIFITCKNLKGISSSISSKPTVKCSPSADFAFKTASRFFGYAGYECKWLGFRFSCRACPIGFYSDCDILQRKMGSCYKCPPGSFYQDEVASTACKTCPVGQYVAPDRYPGKDVSDCRTCPKGTNTNSTAGLRACKCLDGFYRTYRFGRCDKCENEGFVCVRDYPQLKKGYWMTWNGTDLNNRNCKEDFKSFILNLETFNNDYDRSTMHFNCQLPVPIKCPMPDSCNAGIDALCSSGYTGVLCAVCNKGYSRQFNRCVKCPQPYIVVLEFVGYLALFITLCLIIAVTDRIRIASTFDNEQDDYTGSRTFADIIVSSCKILIGFYQVLITVLNAFSNIKWPNSLIKAASILEYIQFQVIRFPSLRCIRPEWNVDSVKEFWLVLIIFLAVPFIASTYFLTKLCYTYVTAPNSFEFKQRRSLCGRNCIKVVALFLFVTYPLTSTKIIQILPVSCHTFCTAKRQGDCLHEMSYLRSDYSISCPTMANDQLTMIVAYCTLCIPFGLPFVLWIILRRCLRRVGFQNHAINDHSYIPFSDTISITGAEDTFNQDVNEDNEYYDFTGFGDQSVDKIPVFKYGIKFTYENYKESCWFWEVLEMIRKLIMNIGVILYLRNTKIGLSGMIIIAMAFALLHAIKKPLKDTFQNFVQLLSLLIIPINLSMAAILQSDATQHADIIARGMDSRMTGIVLVSMNSLLIFLIGVRFIKEIVKKIMKFQRKKND